MEGTAFHRSIRIFQTRGYRNAATHNPIPGLIDSYMHCHKMRREQNSWNLHDKQLGPPSGEQHAAFRLEKRQVVAIFA